MQIDAPLIIAIGAIITAILTFISQLTANKRSARKDEVQLLREEVERLQRRVDELTDSNDCWRKKYDKLYGYVLTLRRTLIDNNIDVPEMPNGDDGISLPTPEDAVIHPKNKK